MYANAALPVWAMRHFFYSIGVGSADELSFSTDGRIFAAGQ